MGRLGELELRPKGTPLTYATCSRHLSWFLGRHHKVQTAIF